MTEKEEKKTKAAKTPVETKVSVQQLVYCGPSLKNLQQYSIFKGKLPDHVAKYINDYPMIHGLLVEPKELPVTMKNLPIKGTRENQLFAAIQDQTKGA